jgi:hypothetical protein
VSIRALVPFVVAAVLSIPSPARAHCDTLDGPVVTTARTALATGKLEPVLAWVQPGDEAEIRDAFAKARAVRGAGEKARDLADRWFFETVVRVHRAGEGAPYTGLKPAGTPEPAVAAADRVIAGGDPRQLEALLVGAVREGLHGHLARLKQERAPGEDVAAGRRFVAAYVPFVHWAEGVHAAARAAGHGAAEGGHAAGHAPASGGPPADAAGQAGHGERGPAVPAKGHAH